MKISKCFGICISIAAVIFFASTVLAESWGIHFPKDGGRPEANASAEHLAQFDAFFMGNENDKVLYLTFDAGYENGLTAGILDTLAEHEVPAAFFLVGTYIRDERELILRMVQEGHIVANHTMTHPDMSKVLCKDAFAKELAKVEDVYKEVTGEELPKFYRPPSGTFNETNLKHAQELGYKTVFWSTAYKDWEVDNQPSHEEAFAKLLPRTYPGAIILLHNVSKTNAEILGDLIVKYKDMGYRFEDLNHLAGVDTNSVFDFEGVLGS
ncbi:MAG: polysaccharide deacetylase family protein [Defluviitaleaceae bacterium]|nr:polysaccharide deacetylase family protein [Defluviitaleaceae bacterium]